MPPRTKPPRLPSVAEQHAEWLSLLRPEGPFLALPVLTEVLPQGLDTVPDETRSRVRTAWTEVSEAPDLLHPAWQDLIIGELLRYPPSPLRVPTEFQGLRPDFVVDGPDPSGGKVTRLHLYRRGFDEPLTSAVHGQPALAERAAQICRDTKVPVAVLTNGQLWVQVHARPGEATSVAVFDADLWLEEPALLRAFASLCSASRVLRPSGGLAELFARSADEHAHVTTTLGNQVRAAVELFVAELARLDRESGGALLAGVSERDIYRGALTALMRLVFLLFAEEQRLLPVTDPIFARGYAVSTLYDQLDAERGLHGDEEADRRSSAWPRLLALFGAIHGGSEHPDLAKNKPFGFLDHALRCGDSLVGLLSEEQLERFHLDTRIGSEAGSNLFRHLHDKIEMTLNDVTDIRQEIEATAVQDARQAAEKAELLANATWMTRKLTLTADAIVGAALSTAVRHVHWYEEDTDETFDDRLDKIANDVDQYLTNDVDDTSVEARLRAKVDDWLRGFRSQPIRPLHWPLEFPEIMRRGGFDAAVGNPPFSGGTLISGRVGKDMQTYLQNVVANGRRAGGRADLCSYFLLRDLDIARRGRVGIIATDSIAQGDSREVSLDQAAENGWSIYRAVKSQAWPGTASLRVSLLWVGRPGEEEPLQLDDQVVKGITSSLDSRSRMTGRPYKLDANGSRSFEGCKPLGMGFILEPEAAHSLIRADPRNTLVLFLYLNGEDLNSRPDCSASRWIINFHDWPLEQAGAFVDCLAIVEREVKPQRLRQNDLNGRKYWWRFLRSRPELNDAIVGMERVVAIPRHSATGLPQFVRTGQVMSEALVVFAPDRSGDLALLSSSAHYIWWTAKGESTLRGDARYTPSDGFETFPQPSLIERMDRVEEELDSFRCGVMLGQELGLTKLYKLVHDPAVTDEEIRRLREIHTEIDYATAEAYGWGDLELGHGFYETRQGGRFTIAPDVQVEVLDRLLELNHERYAEEVRQGLHDKGRRKGKRGKKLAAARPADEDALFEI